MSTYDASYLSIEEIISLPYLHDTSVREDGQKVAYVRKTSDWEENVYRQHVWVYDKNTDMNYPITVGKSESKHPRWSPKYNDLAYLSPVGEGEDKKLQLFLLPSHETTAIQISHTEQSIDNFKWAPDGTGIFFTSKRPESKEMKQRKEVFGEFTYIDQDYLYNALYFLDLEKAKQKRELLKLPKDLWNCSPVDFDVSLEKDKDETILPLTEATNLYIHHYDISPDGSQIIFNASPTPKIIDFHDLKLYMLNMKTKEIAHLEITPLHIGTVLFSMDGTKICYNRYIEKKEIFNNITLEIYDLNSKKTFQPVKHIDENVVPVNWNKSGILITWQERTNYLVGLIPEDGKLTRLVDENDMVASSPSISLDGKNFACTKATSLHPTEIYLNDERITNQYKLYKGKVKSHKEVISWETEDGLIIEGILSKPINYDSSLSYPLILAVHGGPVSASVATPTTNTYQPIEQFVEKGFLVLEPNYRGSSGYGEAFRKANYRHLGLGDYEDVISGVDHLIEQGMVDRDKVGIMGWSQGGYISAFCATYSNRFKAISVGAGISNWMTYYVNTDITQFTRFYLGNTPWNDEDIYRKTSPMTYINNASTPTLIQHGEKDARVPVPNAFELYRGLKDVGVETELVIFKGMEHGSNKPGINRAILKQNVDWFSHHILEEDIDKNRSY